MTWTRSLSAIARDEAGHLALVVRALHRRGGAFVPGHTNRYARKLHALVRWGTSEREILDRLLVAAVIELRSYERFLLLAARMDDPALRQLYRRLGESERGHYLQFTELAALLSIDAPSREARWDEFCRAESEIIRSQPIGSFMHSGVSTSPVAGECGTAERA